MKSEITWHPISELPEYKEEYDDDERKPKYLVAISAEYEGKFVMEADYMEYGYNEKHPFSIPGWSRLPVTHWAYMPDYPKQLV